MFSDHNKIILEINYRKIPVNFQEFGKINTNLPLDPVIPQLGIYPDESKTSVCTKTCL